MTRTHIRLAGIAVLGGLLCGCGPGSVNADTGSTSAANPQLRASGSPQPMPGSAVGAARAIAARWAAAPALAFSAPIEIRSIDFTATVFNPGSPDGFTAFITTRRTTLVTSASAARIEASNGARPQFATPADHALWKAAGRPALGQAPAAGQTQIIPTGNYSFIPQGSTLTYRQATAMATEPHQLAASILDHLRPYSGAHPPASLEFKQLAYLIATAPLADAARAAAWRAVASLPGLRTCRTQSGQPGPRAITLCIDSADDETLVSVGLDTGAILTIADRLLRRSPVYPHVRAGTIIESSSFPQA